MRKNIAYSNLSNQYIKSAIFLCLSLVPFLAAVNLSRVYAMSTTSGALNASTSNTSKDSNSASTGGLSATAQKTHLTNIINKGNDEISRRLSSLGSVLNKITTNTKLSTTDQTDLTDEVNTEISGLTSLKSQLDSETTLSAAITDAKSIISDYRVYALILPKVWIIVTADSQLITEGKLTSLAQAIQTRLSNDQSSASYASLEADLTQMQSDITSSQTISNTLESSVLPLQPSDYDSDQTILNGDLTQLKTAHNENVSAYNEATTIINSLKSS